MKRGYCKEGNTKPGRPKTKVPRRPADFLPCDTSGWDVRRFLRELVIRQGEHEWQTKKEEWKRDPEDTSWDRLTPASDPDEINRFLARLPAVSQITSQECAAHALRLGMILIAVDPHTPNLVERLSAEADDIRARHPLPIKDRGRPHTSSDVAGVDDQKLAQWRDHRIVDLYDLISKGHDPRKERLPLAWWLFKDDYPNFQARRARGSKLDRAVDLLNQALSLPLLRMMDAQTRENDWARSNLLGT
jgi:hypothetical protein